MGTPDIAAEILIEGRVQGVGYRDYARRRASGLGLGGWVANLGDGRVRVRAEGSRGQIEALVRALEQGPPLSKVARVDVRWIAPAGTFAGFDVRVTEPEA
ncbi:MAG TPA: acylphosphatase [Candidatus Binatia bacterium]|nr:acylphosphatase [Candidatus Binatia bacterium]